MFSFLPRGFLEERSTSSIPSSSRTSVPSTSVSSNSNNVERNTYGSNVNLISQILVEENIAEPVRLIDSQETHDETMDVAEMYFSDSSEEFNMAELIENGYQADTGRFDSDNGNDDINNNNNSDNDSDSDDANDTTQQFFHIDKSAFNFPFLSNPNFYENDHLLSVISMSVRYNLSYEATLSMLTWIKISHKNNNLPTTKKALWKALHRDESLIRRYLYCGVCKEIVGIGKTPSKECACNSCSPGKKSSNLHYFLQLNLFSQLTEFFKIPNIGKSLEYRFIRENRDSSAIEDIFDGDVYKNLCAPEEFLNNPFNFSLTINTDGCQVAKSSKASAWPVYFQINELPPHMRKKHMLLAGIFVDTCHPSLNILLRPIVDEMIELYETGIIWKISEHREVTSKFIVTTCSVDSPARSSITRMRQFNGYTGCTFCYAEGQRYGNKHIYPRSHGYGQLRTDEEMRRDMSIAYETKEITNGIKGISCLVGLPEFDLCNGIVVESLHAVFLGAVKQHTNLLLNTADSPFYIGHPTDKKRINNRLLSIKPPSRRTRVPREIDTFNQWKGSELRNWLDYVAPCLDGILQVKYINHFALLSQAIHYLNSDSVTMVDLETAGRLIEKYVTKFEELFGLENMSYNIHLLTHLSTTVKNLGPMWVHSASVFESWNKKIMDNITSPHGRADQIITRFLMNKFIQSAVHSNLVSTETEKFICDTLRIPNINNDITINKDFEVISSPETINLKEVELNILRQIDYDPKSFVSAFTKIKVNSIDYNIQNNKDNKFCNFVICYKNNFFGEIISIIEFINADDNKIQGFFIKPYKIIKCAFGTDYMKEIEITNDIVFLDNLKSVRPATKICTDLRLFVFKLPNCWETD
ncbi:uncharacterized protein LOC130674389 [Microplitis mediator]|uniref:uncharacterized protein LOC130674389 n=1 Tax=Microplitis mediator TaxID=375433 RepID=UPI0025570B70|nr:uncharacterized protein LOC130674389 [Microplitis mediator]